MSDGLAYFRKRMPADERAGLVPIIGREYESGMTLRDLSKKYGYNVEWVRRMVMKSGVKMRPRGRKMPPITPEDAEEIGKEYEGGMSLRKLSERHPGMGIYRIRAIVIDTGRTMREQGWIRKS